MTSYKHSFSRIMQLSDQNNAVFSPKKAMMGFEISYVKYLGQVLSFVYCLMENKKMTNYKHLYSRIMQLSEVNNTVFSP